MLSGWFWMQWKSQSLRFQMISKQKTPFKIELFCVHLVATERVWSEFLRRKGQFGGRSLIISQRDALNVTPVSTLPPPQAPHHLYTGRYWRLFPQYTGRGNSVHDPPKLDLPVYRPFSQMSSTGGCQRTTPEDHPQGHLLCRWAFDKMMICKTRT